MRETLESTASCDHKETKIRVRQRVTVPSSKSKLNERDCLISQNEAQSLTGNGVKAKVLSEDKRVSVKVPPGF